MWSSTVTFPYTQRFVCNSAAPTSRTISNIDLFDLKCMAQAAAVANRVFGGVRLQKVQAWCANSAGNASNTIEIELLTTNPYTGSRNRISSDTAMGVANVAYASIKTRSNELSGQWLAGVVGTEFPIFNITCPLGTVVDVTMVIELIDDSLGVLVTGTVAAATAGILYTRHLDSTNAAPTFVPVGVNYI